MRTEFTFASLRGPFTSLLPYTPNLLPRGRKFIQQVGAAVAILAIGLLVPATTLGERSAQAAEIKPQGPTFSKLLKNAGTHFKWNFTPTQKEALLKWVTLQDDAGLVWTFRIEAGKLLISMPSVVKGSRVFRRSDPEFSLLDQLAYDDARSGLIIPLQNATSSLWHEMLKRETIAGKKNLFQDALKIPTADANLLLACVPQYSDENSRIIQTYRLLVPFKNGDSLDHFLVDTAPVLKRDSGHPYDVDNGKIFDIAASGICGAVWRGMHKHVKGENKTLLAFVDLEGKKYPFQTSRHGLASIDLPKKAYPLMDGLGFFVYEVGKDGVPIEVTEQAHWQARIIKEIDDVERQMIRNGEGLRFISRVGLQQKTSEQWVPIADASAYKQDGRTRRMLDPEHRKGDPQFQSYLKNLASHATGYEGFVILHSAKKQAQINANKSRVNPVTQPLYAPPSAQPK